MLELYIVVKAVCGTPFGIGGIFTKEKDAIDQVAKLESERGEDTPDLKFYYIPHSVDRSFPAKLMGSMTSTRKAAASRQNGLKGGKTNASMQNKM